MVCQVIADIADPAGTKQAHRSRRVMKWLLLVYRIPREPSAGRVAVWRKLKKTGAVALQDAVWVLPRSERNLEQFQWLAAEIVESGGEASLFDAEPLITSVEASLRDRFEEPVRRAYQGILEALKRRNPDLAELSKKYQQAKSRDFFQCPIGERARAKLLSRQEEAS
jgi:DNA-binding transcriptional regulator PaaX